MKIDGIEFENFDFQEVRWTMDCGGKQDFDFPVLHVSTRYWPDFTASPSIHLGDRVLARLPKGEYITGESETQCKQRTEQWIRQEVTNIINKLLNAK